MRKYNDMTKTAPAVQAPAKPRATDPGENMEIPPGMTRGVSPLAAALADTEQHKRPYVQAPVVTDPGLPCPHCGERYGHKTANTYPNGMRRMLCAKCAKPFPARRLA